MDLNLKEYKLPLESFIQGWYIDESICDDIINLFNDRKEYWVKGIVADKVQPDRKQSTDLYVNKNDTTEPIFSYRTQLQWCLEQYVKIYPELEKALLNLLHTSGYPNIKFEKKVDFDELYNKQFN